MMPFPLSLQQDATESPFANSFAEVSLSSLRRQHLRYFTQAALIRAERRTFAAEPGNFGAPADVDEAMSFDNFAEEVQVLGRDLVDKIRDLIHEGNVQRIVVKDEHGNTFIEIPVTVAAVGVVMAPLLAAIGAISALVAKFNIVIVRNEPKPPEERPQAPGQP